MFGQVLAVLKDRCGLQLQPLLIIPTAAVSESVRRSLPDAMERMRADEERCAVQNLQFGTPSCTEEMINPV